MKYSIEQIEQIAASLHLPPNLDKTRPTYSKQEVINLITEEINILRNTGYSLEQTAEILRNNGLEITSSTLKNYLQRAKASAQERGKTGKKPSTRAKPGKHGEASPGNSTPVLPANSETQET